LSIIIQESKVFCLQIVEIITKLTYLESAKLSLESLEFTKKILNQPNQNQLNQGQNQRNQSNQNPLNQESKINCLSHCVIYDLAPQNSHLFENTFQKFKQLQNDSPKNTNGIIYYLSQDK
jgi:hypothetical protein